MRRHLGKELGVDEVVAELAGGVVLLCEGFEFVHLWVLLGEAGPFHGEEFGPVGTRVEGGELFFDEGEELLDSGPHGFPGEMDCK